MSLADCLSRRPLRVTAEGIHEFVEHHDEGFSTRWAQHPKPQATTDGIFELKTGWKLHDLEGRTVIDAGCGCGRFTQVALRAGARVIALDCSMDGLRATVANAGDMADRLLPVRGDLLDPPIATGTVDAAFSIGVLHHTGDTRKAFLAVADSVKPGGKFAVWVYTQPVVDVLLPASMFLHEITRACPPAVLYAACEKYAVQLRNIYRQHPDLGPLAAVLQASGSADDEECISDTFDWHTPQYRDWHTAPEVAGWFREADYNLDWIGEFPVSASGTRRGE